MVDFWENSDDFKDLQDIVNDLVDQANDIGNLGGLTTSAQTVVDAINELDAEIGDLSTLPTTDKSSLVNAIIEIYNNVGDLTNLNTTAQGSIVDAINELVVNIADNSTDITNALNQLIDRSGNEATLVTGDAGTPDNYVIWDANGNVADSGNNIGDLIIINEIMGD